ncbi:type II toxin-antitoxin system RelB/DinJ family antitoxin [Candidatus Azambacteria bacterium]|nr:type II toxin-antitoxin system RelB/DinJ family antitoxin [Candidatus Azambacteria bacterium]
MKTMITIKADSHIKKQAQDIAENMGLTLSALVNAFLHEVVNKKKVTFSVWPMIVKADQIQTDGYVYDENFLKKLAREAKTFIKTKNFRKLTSLRDLQ